MTCSSGKPCPIYAVIPAAGVGTRMQADRNKQFLRLGRFPLIIRTLRVFESHPQIDGYLVVAAPNEVAAMRDLILSFGFSRCLAVTAGGETRQQSVANGLSALAECADSVESSLALVHDGARCFVTSDVISRVVAGIFMHSACGAAVPVKDTIKRANPDGSVLETPDRSHLWSMQTPQGAWYPLLDGAYKLAAMDGFTATDDLAVLEHAGHAVWLTAGDYGNIKLTTPEDRLLAEMLAERADQEDALAAAGEAGRQLDLAED